jgi:hypothetical protein
MASSSFQVSRQFFSNLNPPGPSSMCDAVETQLRLLQWQCFTLEPRFMTMPVDVLKLIYSFLTGADGYAHFLRSTFSETPLAAQTTSPPGSPSGYSVIRMPCDYVNFIFVDPQLAPHVNEHCRRVCCVCQFT